MAKLFALAITPFGSVFVGKLDKGNFGQWQRRMETLKIIHPKRLVVAPGNTQAADPRMQSAMIQIGPAYFGDTDQEYILADSICVELIGEIVIERDEEVCNENRKMFNAYKKSVKEYAARNSTIAIPSVSDINAISKAALKTSIQK